MQAGVLQEFCMPRAAESIPAPITWQIPLCPQSAGPVGLGRSRHTDDSQYAGTYSPCREPQRKHYCPTGTLPLSLLSAVFMDLAWWISRRPTICSHMLCRERPLGRYLCLWYQLLPRAWAAAGVQRTHSMQTQVLHAESCREDTSVVDLASTFVCALSCFCGLGRQQACKEVAGDAGAQPDELACA